MRFYNNQIEVLAGVKPSYKIKNKNERLHTHPQQYQSRYEYLSSRRRRPRDNLFKKNNNNIITLPSGPSDLSDNGGRGKFPSHLQKNWSKMAYK